jgi:hypothetical protein
MEEEEDDDDEWRLQQFYLDVISGAWGNKSKHGVRPSVCVDKNWAVPGRFFQSLPVPCGAGDKQGRGRAGHGRAGRPGQPLWGGRARCHFY